MSTSTSWPGPSKKINSWVRPGVLEVRANALRPVSALMRLDLPTLDRPANAISGAVIRGSDSSELAAEAKSHSPANSRRPMSRSALENSPSMLRNRHVRHWREQDGHYPVLQRRGRARPGGV